MKRKLLTFIVSIAMVMSLTLPAYAIGQAMPASLIDNEASISVYDNLIVPMMDVGRPLFVVNISSLRTSRMITTNQASDPKQLFKSDFTNGVCSVATNFSGGSGDAKVGICYIDSDTSNCVDVVSSYVPGNGGDTAYLYTSDMDADITHYAFVKNESGATLSGTAWYYDLQ